MRVFDHAAAAGAARLTPHAQHPAAAGGPAACARQQQQQQPTVTARPRHDPRRRNAHTRSGSMTNVKNTLHAWIIAKGYDFPDLVGL